MVVNNYCYGKKDKHKNGIEIPRGKMLFLKTMMRLDLNNKKMSR